MVPEASCVTAVPVTTRLVPLTTVTGRAVGARELDASQVGAYDFGSDNRAVFDHRRQGVDTGRNDLFHGWQQNGLR
ncbi:MAG: hypothetical protein JWL68_3794, partial [Actinomycetia bacterium]|nr:hypothetical protein [Actinomycetes bacterium]